jgi:hypothetical protein
MRHQQNRHLPQALRPTIELRHDWERSSRSLSVVAGSARVSCSDKLIKVGTTTTKTRLSLVDGRQSVCAPSPCFDCCFFFFGQLRVIFDDHCLVPFVIGQTLVSAQQREPIFFLLGPRCPKAEGTVRLIHDLAPKVTASGTLFDDGPAFAVIVDELWMLMKRPKSSHGVFAGGAHYFFRRDVKDEPRALRHERIFSNETVRWSGSPLSAIAGQRCALALAACSAMLGVRQRFLANNAASVRSPQTSSFFAEAGHASKSFRRRSSALHRLPLHSVFLPHADSALKSPQRFIRVPFLSNVSDQPRPPSGQAVSFE